MRRWGFRTRVPARAEVPAPQAPPEPDPPATDDAWRTLLLVVDFVKHAETKAAATLAFAGVLGGVLYTLVSQQKKPGVVLIVAAAGCALTIVATAVAAGVALRPRVRVRLEGSSPALLFYRSVADRFPDDADAYVRQFTALTADRPALLAAVAEQIWANSVVATRKYRAAHVAVTASLVASGALAVTATVALLPR